MESLTLNELYERIKAVSTIDAATNKEIFKNLPASGGYELTKKIIGRTLGLAILSNNINPDFNKIITILCHGSNFLEISSMFQIEKEIGSAAKEVIDLWSPYFWPLGEPPMVQIFNAIYNRAFVKIEQLPLDMTAAKVRLATEAIDFNEDYIYRKKYLPPGYIGFNNGPLDYLSEGIETVPELAAMQFIKLAENGLRYSFQDKEYYLIRKLISLKKASSPPPPIKNSISDKYQEKESSLDSAVSPKMTLTQEEWKQTTGSNPNFQLYPRRYYAGPDARIFFDNEPVGEITEIEYTLEESHAPIFGYASYTYDSMAKGSRIVIGKLKVNFVEEWYLKAILTKLSRNKINSSNPRSPFMSSAAENTKNPISKEQLLNVLNGQRPEDIRAIPEDIRAIAEEYEGYIWGRDGGWTIDKYQDTYFTDKKSLLSKYGFDIVITWGNELFDIAGLTYDINETQGTVTNINGVYLTSVKKSILPIGENIVDEFTFIGRDLNNTLITEEQRKEKAVSQYIQDSEEESLEREKLNQIRSAINEIIWMKSIYESPKVTQEDKIWISGTDNQPGAVAPFYAKLAQLAPEIKEKLKQSNYTQSIDWYDTWLLENNLMPRGK